MKFEVLLAGLDNPQPAVRLDVVRVLGMLDEVRALDALRARHAQETDPSVREAISWAGKRLYQAQQAGYSTLDELFRHFGVNREIENLPTDETEAELLRRMQSGLDRDLMQMQTRATNRKAGMAAAAAFGGMVVGGTMLGATVLTGAMAPGAETASSGMGASLNGSRRAPVTAPANTPIDVWVRRLRESPKSEQREQATIELAQLNNPKALPFLAAAFVADQVPQVRQSAQKFGKILYWNMVYWEMEQDGSLFQEMERRAAAMGKNVKINPEGGIKLTGQAAVPGITTDQPAAKPAEPQVDVAEILRKAQQARSERKRK
ncbi:MAG: HEAT repeat domain-containing protein [Chloroflexi bacterium]|nr:HEAT repeat domain-containing protein [Chloroflexota bacterium]